MATKTAPDAPDIDDASATRLGPWGRLGWIIDPGCGDQEHEQGARALVSGCLTAVFPPAHDGLAGRVVNSPIPPRPASFQNRYFEHLT